MPEIKTNYPLQSLNTFGILVYAKHYVEIDSVEQLPELVNNPIFVKNEVLILGGGSNILFTKNYSGLILHIKIQGIEVLEEDGLFVIAGVGGGIIWDEFVSYAVSANWGGIENLSAIPGSVGAAPVQNIGAYGVEAGDIIEKVEGYDLKQQEFISFTRNECRFQYRNSIFKEQYRNRFVITRVLFKLKKVPHELITQYGDISSKLSELPEQSISTMRQLITGIRASKLPDYKINGNAGSFFKNPVVEKEVALQLKNAYPEMPMFPDDKGKIKLSGAWLIEKAGCKGLHMGNAGTHPKQALVLVNLGNASGNEILELARHIQKTVKNKFEIILEAEVNII